MKVSEFEEQKKLIYWASFKKEIKDIIFAIPNGGSRNKLEARNLKISGVRAGVPDIFIPYPTDKYHGLFIEMKSKKGVLSKKQKDFIDIMNSKNYLAIVCYGADEAILKINEYIGK